MTITFKMASSSQGPAGIVEKVKACEPAAGLKLLPFTPVPQVSWRASLPRCDTLTYRYDLLAELELNTPGLARVYLFFYGWEIR